MKKEDVEDYILKKKIDDGVNVRIRAICITATGAVLGVFYQIGHFIYEKWIPFQAALEAFIKASKP